MAATAMTAGEHILAGEEALAAVEMARMQGDQNAAALLVQIATAHFTAAIAMRTR